MAQDEFITRNEFWATISSIEDRFALDVFNQANRLEQRIAANENNPLPWEPDFVEGGGADETYWSFKTTPYMYDGQSDAHYVQVLAGSWFRSRAGQAKRDGSQYGTQWSDISFDSVGDTIINIGDLAGGSGDMYLFAQKDPGNIADTLGIDPMEFFISVDDPQPVNQSMQSICLASFSTIDVGGGPYLAGDIKQHQLGDIKQEMEWDYRNFAMNISESGDLLINGGRFTRRLAGKNYTAPPPGPFDNLASANDPPPPSPQTENELCNIQVGELPQTIINAGGSIPTGYIYVAVSCIRDSTNRLEIDEGQDMFVLVGTSLTSLVEWDGSRPRSHTDADVLVLGKVKNDPTNGIVEIDQWHIGDHQQELTVGNPYCIDGRAGSGEYAGTLQFKGWDTEAVQANDPTSHVVVRSEVDGELRYEEWYVPVVEEPNWPDCPQYGIIPDIIYDTLYGYDPYDWLAIEVPHNSLDFNPLPFDRRVDAELNEDHDYRYGVLGETWESVFFTSIGFSGGTYTPAVPVQRIDLQDRLLQGGQWVAEHTADASQADASFRTLGGVRAEKGIYSNKGSADAAGEFVDDNNTVKLADNNAAATFDDGGVTTGIICNSFKAANFGDGSNIVDICDLTNAVTATGNIVISGASGDFYHNDKQGSTIGDLTSGGVVFLPDPVVIRVQVEGYGGLQRVKVLGVVL